MIDEFEIDGRQLAIVVRNSFHRKGIEFFTPGNYSQQLGFMNHPKGHEILPHFHKRAKREVEYTQEVLIIRSGRLRVDFYDRNQAYVESTILDAGDVVLLASGGHGFQAIEDVEFFEVKQGPYTGQEDKVRFHAVAQNQLRFRGDSQ